MILAPPPPLSPFVTNLVEPPPPYVTGPNGDKLFSWLTIRKYMKKIVVGKYMEYVFKAHFLQDVERMTMIGKNNGR